MVKDMVLIYSGILLSHRKNERMSLAAMWTDLEMITLGKVSQKEKDRYYVLSFTHGI